MRADPAAAAPVVELRWRPAGCLTLFTAAGALFFASLASNPNALDWSDARGGKAFGLLAAVTAGGVSLPFLLIALWLVWLVGRSGWRWADEAAATATPHGLRFHPSLFRRPLPWAEVADVRFDLRRRGEASSPRIVVTGRHGRRIILSPVDDEGGRAKRFAALARERLSTSAGPQGRKAAAKQGE